MNPGSSNGLDVRRTTIDRILECAVAVNWKELTKAQSNASMRIEYRRGPKHSLEYLKLWSSSELSTARAEIIEAMNQIGSAATHN